VNCVNLVVLLIFLAPPDTALDELDELDLLGETLLEDGVEISSFDLFDAHSSSFE